MRPRSPYRDVPYSTDQQHGKSTRKFHRILITALLCLSALMEMSTQSLRNHQVRSSIYTISELSPDSRRSLSFREEAASATRINRPNFDYDASLYRAETTAGHSWRDVKVDFFANNGFSRALRTTSAMGEYVASVNTTYVVYQGPHEDPYIVAFEHTTSTWVGPIHVGVSMLGRLTDPLIPITGTAITPSPMVGNNHGQPSLVVDSNGYLHISYGGDGGDEQFVDRLIDGMSSVEPSSSVGLARDDYGNGRIIHATSEKPHDIREWTTHTSRSGSPLSWRGSECQFVKVPSQKQSPSQNASGSSPVTLYHFCRHGYRAASITYQVSTDDGETWSVPTALLQTNEKIRTSAEAGTDIVIRDGWSCRFRAGSLPAVRHIIAAVCSYNRIHTAPDNASGNITGSDPHTRSRSSSLPTQPTTATATSSYNGYYLELDSRTQQWRNVQGKLLSELPLTKEQADIWIRALDTEKVTRTQANTRPSIRPVAVTMIQPGYPHLLFRAPLASIDSRNSHSTRTTADAQFAEASKKLWYVRWTGDAWSKPAMVVVPTRDITGIILDPYDEDGDLAISVDGSGDEVVTVTVSLTNQTHSVVQNFMSRDRGWTWSHRRSVDWMAIRRHHGRFHTSARVINGRPEARMVAFLEEEPVSQHYHMAYRKMYLIGDNGPVVRTRREAEVCRGIKTSKDGSMCGDWETTIDKNR